MIRNCQSMPANFVAQNTHARESAVIANSNPYLSSHKVRVQTDLMRAEAFVLWPPAIQYNQVSENWVIAT